MSVGLFRCNFTSSNPQTDSSEGVNWVWKLGVSWVLRIQQTDAHMTG